MEIQEQVSVALKGMQDEFGKLTAELKGYVDKEVAEKTKNGVMDPGTAESIAKMEKAIQEHEVKMDAEIKAINQELTRPGFARFSGAEVKSVGEQLAEDDGYREWVKAGFPARSGYRGYSRSFKGFFPVERKSVISLSGLGSATSGVVPFMREPGIDQLPRQELRIRDILNVVPKSEGSQWDYMQQNVFTNAASPQTEGSAKAESTITYTTGTAVARTIAHFANVTKQALQDVDGIQMDINEMLTYGLKLKEESELLWGDGLGDHLHGIGTQATAYDTGLNVSGDTKLDKLRHAIFQARLALFPVDAIVLHPEDLHDIELIKEDSLAANTGRYIVGDPRTGVSMLTLWGKMVVESDSAVSGTFLVGAFRRGATVYDRQQANLDISFEHSSNFTENKATILAEERIALAVKRTLAFVKGSF